ncbi:hypothetical protein LCGC14_0777850 [marine sediment metagenome]|uniref:Uncharacterized protein n=1 Tax=marine sediment metagenome TaxID=412755 RepID=A0A0F9T3E5_9ZZZZ
MPLQTITAEDELIHDIDQMIATLKLRRAAIVARRPAPVSRRPGDTKITHKGRVWDFDLCTKGKKRGKKS